MKIRHVIFLIFLVIFLFRPLLTIVEKSDYLFSAGYEKKYEEYKYLYYNSQFVKKENPIIITDEYFISFAGGAFLKGLNPILITHDHPPLGNYIISLSILLFDNPRTIVVFLLAAATVGFYLLSRLAIKNSLVALIPVGIFINEPIFLNKFEFIPLVGSIQLPFIIFAFYFFIKAVTSKKYLKWFLLTSLFLGAIISIRFFVTGAVITFCMILFLLFQQRKIDRKFISFIFTLPIALVVLVLSYTRTMLDGYSVLQIFGIQKYILSYHQSKFILPFSFWDLILFNKWHTWWGDKRISFDPQWILTWPISVVLTALFAVASLLKKLSSTSADKFLMTWLGIYTLTLSIGYSSTNYFLAIIPFLYIVSTSFIYKLFILLRKKTN